MSKMKNCFMVLIILVIGLLLFGGCTSTVEPQQNDKQDQANQEPQDNPQNGEENAPQPPALPEG